MTDGAKKPVQPGVLRLLAKETGEIFHLLFAPVKKKPAPPESADAAVQAPPKTPQASPSPADPTVQTQEVRRRQMEKEISPTVTLRRTIIDEVVVKKEERRA